MGALRQRNHSDQAAPLVLVRMAQQPQDIFPGDPVEPTGKINLSMGKSYVEFHYMIIQLAPYD